MAFLDTHGLETLWVQILEKIGQSSNSLNEKIEAVSKSSESLTTLIETKSNFYINLTPTGETHEGMDVYLPDKTLTEIIQAYNLGQSIYVRDDNGIQLSLTVVSEEMFLFLAMADSVVAYQVGDGFALRRNIFPLYQEQIANDLSTNDPSMVLSAAQGAVLNEKIEAEIAQIEIPVTSVNNKTGDVELTASDIGALPNTTVIPNNLSNGVGEGSISQSSEALGKNSFSQSANQTIFILLDQDINNDKTYTYSDPNGNEKVQIGDIIFLGNRGSSVETIINSSTFTTKDTLSIDGTVAVELVRGATLGENSHSEGEKTNAIGKNSHSEGLGTIALGDNQHVAGKYNLADSTYAYILGNGTSNARANAHTLNWDGTAWFANAVKIGGVGQDDTAAKNLATEGYVEEAIDLHVADNANPHNVTAFQSGAMEFINKNLNIQVASVGDITYGLDKFVAVSYGRNEASYSYDGITWHKTTLPYSEFWKTVIYGNRMFIALAESTKNIAYSYDGINWQGTTSLPSSLSWKSVIYGAGKYMAVASNSNKIYHSSDGFTWSTSNLPSSKNWQAIACYGFPAIYVIVAKGSATTAYSSDGTTWSSGSMPSSANWVDVCYGADKFVAIADGSSVGAYSSDGINWQSMNMPRSTTWTSIHYHYKTNLFIAVSKSNYAAYSSDGINWSDIIMPSTSLSTIAYNDELGVYIASGGSSYTVRSADGINWKKNVSGIFQNGQDITDTIRLLLANSN